MLISQRGIDLIKDVEGFRPQPYNDADQNSTIGYGTLLHKGPVDTVHNELDRQYINGISEYTAERLLLTHVNVEVYPLFKKYVTCALNQNQFDALCSFLYNVGGQAFRNEDGTPTGLSFAIAHGRLDQVPTQLKRWVYSGGKMLTGLIGRRAKEAALWCEAPAVPTVTAQGVANGSA